MRGKVRKVAGKSTVGAILGDDAVLYSYAPDALHGADPKIGQEVMFDISSKEARNIYIMVSIDARARLRQRNWIAFYLSPRGRVSRKDYWVYGVLVVLLAEFLIDLMFAGGEAPFVSTPLSIVFGWACVVLTFKRFQDRGYSGWWSLLPYGLILPAAALLFTGAFWSAEPMVSLTLMRISALMGGVAALTGVWALFWVPIWRGETGYNRFGPDPLRDAA